MYCMNSYEKTTWTLSKGLFVKLEPLAHMAFLPKECHCGTEE